MMPNIRWYLSIFLSVVSLGLIVQFASQVVSDQSALASQFTKQFGLPLYLRFPSLPWSSRNPLPAGRRFSCDTELKGWGMFRYSGVSFAIYTPASLVAAPSLDASSAAFLNWQRLIRTKDHVFLFGGVGYARWSWISFYGDRKTPPQCGGWEWRVYLPAWLLAVVTAVLPSAIVWRLWKKLRDRRRRQTGSGWCKECGYDLRATPDRCPECGTAASKLGG
jgi:hypothetical protein